MENPTLNVETRAARAESGRELMPCARSALRTRNQWLEWSGDLEMSDCSNGRADVRLSCVLLLLLNLDRLSDGRQVGLVVCLLGLHDERLWRRTPNQTGLVFSLRNAAAQGLARGKKTLSRFPSARVLCCVRGAWPLASCSGLVAVNVFGKRKKERWKAKAVG